MASTFHPRGKKQSTQWKHPGEGEDQYFRCFYPYSIMSPCRIEITHPIYMIFFIKIKHSKTFVEQNTFISNH